MFGDTLIGLSPSAFDLFYAIAASCCTNCYSAGLSRQPYHSGTAKNRHLTLCRRCGIAGPDRHTERSKLDDQFPSESFTIGHESSAPARSSLGVEQTTKYPCRLTGLHMPD